MSLAQPVLHEQFAFSRHNDREPDIPRVPDRARTRFRLEYPNQGRASQFFRIADSVSLSVRTLEEDINPIPCGTAILARPFDDMSRDVIRQLERSRDEHPILTMYLDTINTKLDRIANWLDLRELELPAEPTHEVEICASGIGFVTDKRIR